MNEQSSLIAGHWSASLIGDWLGELIPGEDTHCPAAIIEVDEVARLVAKPNTRLFSRDAHSEANLTRVTPSLLGERLLACMNCNFVAIRRYLRRYRLSPYFDLLEEHVKRNRLPSKLDRESLGQLDDWVRAFRNQAQSRDFKAKVRSHYRVSIDDAYGVKASVRAMHRKHHKLVVVRLILGHNRAMPAVILEIERDPTIAQQLFSRLLVRLHQRFSNLEWLSWRLEHGQARSFFHQLMLVFSGPDESDGVKPGGLVGQLWVHEITQGRGTYINCNAHQAVYGRCGMAGLGIVRDEPGRNLAALECAAISLAKVSAFAQIEASGVRKTFCAAPRKHRPPVRRQTTRPFGGKGFIDPKQVGQHNFFRTRRR